MRILFWLAILPSILLALRVLAYDRIEKEPFKLLIKVFILGMLSCVPAFVIEALGERLIYSVARSSRDVSMLTFLVLVPLAEEGVKYLALRTTHDNPEFNYTFDGIVYGVMAGLGFATLENVLYVLESMSFEVAVMRGLLSVPLHCTCGIFMGYYYGVARGQEVRGEAREAKRANVLSIVAPWIIHGIYDYSLDTESLGMLVFGLVFTVVVFILASRQVRYASAHDIPIMVSLTQELIQPLPTPEPKAGPFEWRSKGTPPPPFNR